MGEILSVINMAKNIKQIHPNFLICYKVGAFYHCYGKDAYLLSYLFGYKIKEAEKNVSVSGFPKNAMPKIMARLEREKINYIVIDTRNNYDVETQEDFNNLNRYDEKFEESRKIVNLRRRVEKICELLIEEADIKKIRKIEEFVYENREI